MGWANGSGLMETIIKAAKKVIPDEKARAAFYRKVHASMTADHDWDTENEVIGLDPVFDKVLKAAWKKSGMSKEEIKEAFGG